MTRDQATQTADRLNRESPDRERFLWMACRGSRGDWQVVKMSAPRRPPRKLTPEIGARPHKPDPGQLEPPPQPKPYWA